MHAPRIGIAAAAASSGVPVDTLRVWERRYGFPNPSRAENGDRLYDVDDLKRLTLIGQLIRRGHRAGRIVRLDLAQLEELEGSAARDAERRVPIDLQSCLMHLSGDSIPALRRLLQSALVRQGLGHFILDTARPLVQLVGDWWAQGKLQVYQEHLFTEQLERLLREAMAPLDAETGVSIVLTTFPGERHGLGLSMLEAMLRLEGAACVPIGTETPPEEIAKMCRASKPHGLALSFSAGYDDSNGRRGLTFLRRELPDVAIWAGGRGATRVARDIAGITLVPDLEAGLTACRALQGHS